MHEKPHFKNEYVEPSGSAGAPGNEVPDTVADAGWSELVFTFELKEYPEYRPLEAIKRAYLAMDHLMASRRRSGEPLSTPDRASSRD